MPISREAELVKLLRVRKPIFPRPFREDILIRLEKTGEKLRDPDYFANALASSILGTAISRAINIVWPAGVLVRGQLATYERRPLRARAF